MDTKRYLSIDIILSMVIQPRSITQCFNSAIGWMWHH